MVTIKILVGSTLGATEYVAEATQPFLEEAGLTSEISFIPLKKRGKSGIKLPEVGNISYLIFV